MNWTTLLLIFLLSVLTRVVLELEPSTFYSGIFLSPFALHLRTKQVGMLLKLMPLQLTASRKHWPNFANSSLHTPFRTS